MTIYKKCIIIIDVSRMERFKEVERSIIKKYRKEIWSRFTKTVRDYELISPNDHVMVCISGGKDSFLLAKCIQELERHGEVPFNAEYVIMNPGYSKKNMKLIMDNAKLLDVPVQVFETDIFDVVTKTTGDSPCYLCARMRRGHLYNKARELGCNKIALGHHFNDVIETTLLSMFYGSEIKTMLPKVKSENFEGLELIRPLYLVKEIIIFLKVWIISILIVSWDIKKIVNILVFWMNIMSNYIHFCYNYINFCKRILITIIFCDILNL